MKIEKKQDISRVFYHKNSFELVVEPDSQSNARIQVTGYTNHIIQKLFKE